MLSLKSIPSDVKKVLATKINIFLTDGASRGNPGPGGWACILLSGENNSAVEIGGHSPKDTNNRMELKATLEALKIAKTLKNSSYIVTDSKFVIDALMSWRHAWKKHNWQKTDGSPVLNVDLFKEIDEVLTHLKVEFIHIDAHRGHPGNTRCDALAVEFAEKKSANTHNGSLETYPFFEKIYFEKTYAQPRYFCWTSKESKDFDKWPDAQKFLKENPFFKIKKIHSPEEIDLILKAHALKTS